MSSFVWPIRVYIEDTDAGGVVFYANYLKFMERARTEHLRSLGIELDVWQDEERRLFVVRALEVKFQKPARFNEQLQVRTSLQRVKRASLVCHQPIYRGEELLIDATVQLACVDADSLSPVAIPAALQEAFRREQ
jgi:acyl-CoA thioester hydrolase